MIKIRLLSAIRCCGCQPSQPGLPVGDKVLDAGATRGWAPTRVDDLPSCPLRTRPSLGLTSRQGLRGRHNGGTNQDQGNWAMTGLAVFLLGVGLLGCSVAVSMSVSNSRLRRYGVHAQGRVIRAGLPGRHGRQCTIEFTDHMGQQVTFKAMFFAHKHNDLVPVMYPPDNPRKAVANDFVDFTFRRTLVWLSSLYVFLWGFVELIRAVAGR
jgi:hypothetical protein